MRRRTVLSAASIALPTALAGCSLLGRGDVVSESSTRDVDVGDGAAVSVVGRNGSIDVTPADGDSVHVAVEKRTRGGQETLDDVEVSIETVGGDLRIRAVYPEDRDLLSSPVVVDFEVALPAGVRLETAQTANGSVTATGVAGDATLASSNGTVTAEDVDGYVGLRSTNGALRATGVAGVDRAVTTNGDVAVELPAVRDDVHVETTNGDVDLRAAPGLAATFDLSSSVGDVTVSGLSLSRSTDSSDHVVGDLNGGGHRVTAETTNGDVTLRAL